MIFLGLLFLFINNNKQKKAPYDERGHLQKKT